MSLPKNFPGRVNKKRIKALDSLKKQLNFWKNHKTSTDDDQKLKDFKIKTKEKEIKILEGRIQSEDVANSRRTKKWRGDKAKLTRN